MAVGKLGCTTCLDRPYVQKELRWAREFGKKIIVVYEHEDQRPTFFDFGKAMAKYKGTEWEYVEWEYPQHRRHPIPARRRLC